ncbi:hypothetical protein Pcinc_018212 [Petrolisthes cinctipes]|uniref:C3H1-type domain-containing protein n=1 Tax=Petrolisthes cinctipes TaxID=88211 RepID=A0AAE1FNG1_PETCI|nr:hypothetical protein Pcinc_018212 [Petrolisthes cinctipes]
MAGLVADYGSSSGEENEDAELMKELSTRINDKTSVNYFESPSVNKEKETKKTKKKETTKQEVLDNPLRGPSSLPSPFEDNSQASVFFNPFHKAQEEKKTVLEKHVKMTDNPKDVLEINGKKICWNYRKGRCKFGHKCKYAHDSDIIKTPLNSEGQTPAAVVMGCGGDLDPSTPLDMAPEEEIAKKKKRPGLSDTVVPSKKVQKIYRKQQAKETPWLLN